MDNLSYQYLDHDFNPEKAGSYTLLLLADRDQFSFAVTVWGKPLLISDMLAWDVLNEPAAENNFLYRDYHKRVIGLPDNGFTFIPVSIFDPGKVADFARFLDVKPTEKVFSQQLDAENQVIFKISENILAAFDHLDVNEIVFAPKGWITAIAGSNPPNENLYVNIRGSKLEILNFRDGRLHFYNSFNFNNADELVYFVSFVAGEMESSPESVTLILSGDIVLTDKNAVRLKEFFGNIALNKVTAMKLPKQFVSNSTLSLTALSLCGSSEAR